MRRISHIERQNRIKFFLYISPWLIGLLAFTVVPMILSIRYSFTDARMATVNDVVPKFVGLKKISSLLNIKMKDIIGIGCSLSDTCVLEKVGKSIAIGNALDEVKDICEKLGIASSIERYERKCKYKINF